MTNIYSNSDYFFQKLFTNSGNTDADVETSDNQAGVRFSFDSPAGLKVMRSKEKYEHPEAILISGKVNLYNI